MNVLRFGTDESRDLNEGGKTLKKRYVIGSMIAILIMAFFAMSALASANSEVWLSRESVGDPVADGPEKATTIREGETVWVSRLANAPMIAMIRRARLAISTQIPFWLWGDCTAEDAVSVSRLANTPLISNKLTGVNLRKRRRDSFLRFSVLLGGVK